MRKQWMALILAMILLLAVTARGEEAADPVCVSYLGPEGTYTQEAVQYFFRGTETLIPRETVNDAIADVQAGTSVYAVIPQENTLGGAVVNYVDALIAAQGVYVVGEVVLPISQTLMGVPGASLEDIRTVCSHAQGLTQSARWREENLPGTQAMEMASTAAAASYVARQQDKSIAAVAAPGAAALYQLEVLAENVQITQANKTRFYVLAGQPLDGEGLTRAVFAATCEGSMVDDVVLALRDAGLEMVALHDRPEGSALGRYHYLIEAEDTAGITREQLEAACALEGVRCLGRFNPVEKGSPQILIERLVVGRAAGGGRDGAALAELAALDPALAEKWGRILALWDQPMEAHVGVPEDLPADDTLCLVALGFQLNPDGSMREELLQRLGVLKAAAERYPNAVIVCTGGGTAADNPSATEAGMMAGWLREQGVDPARILVEDRSLTTAQNAVYTLDLLAEHCPRVRQLAIVSSDYHIATGALLFGAEAILRDSPVTVAGSAAWHAPSGSLSAMFQAGALIELSGDVKTAFEIYYETYDIHELPGL